MPAKVHTKKANTPAKARQWQHVRDAVEAKGGSPGSAVRQANAVVRDTPTRKKK